MSNSESKKLNSQKEPQSETRDRGPGTPDIAKAADARDVAKAAAAVQDVAKAAAAIQDVAKAAAVNDVAKAVAAIQDVAKAAAVQGKEIGEPSAGSLKSLLTDLTRSIETTNDPEVLQTISRELETVRQNYTEITANVASVIEVAKRRGSGKEKK